MWYAHQQYQHHMSTCSLQALARISNRFVSTLNWWSPVLKQHNAAFPTLLPNIPFLWTQHTTQLVLETLFWLSVTLVWLWIPQSTACSFGELLILPFRYLLEGRRVWSIHLCLSQWEGTQTYFPFPKWYTRQSPWPSLAHLDNHEKKMYCFWSIYI